MGGQNFPQQPMFGMCTNRNVIIFSAYILLQGRISYTGLEYLRVVTTAICLLDPNGLNVIGEFFPPNPLQFYRQCFPSRWPSHEHHARCVRITARDVLLAVAYLGFVRFCVLFVMCVHMFHVCMLLSFAKSHDRMK